MHLVFSYSVEPELMLNKTERGAAAKARPARECKVAIGRQNKVVEFAIVLTPVV